MTVQAPREERLTGFGFDVRLRPYWEGRVFRRPTPTADFASPLARASAGGPAGGGEGWKGERGGPGLHLGNFALPGGRGDFGTGAVELMGPRHAFVAVLEYGPDEVGTALFPEMTLPRPRAEDFSPNALQQRLAGQLGYQRFLTLNGRPLCLFVVLGSQQEARTLCTQVNETLDGIEVS